MAVVKTAARLPVRSVLLVPLLGALAVAALLASCVAYQRFSRRVYFPFERRPASRSPRVLSQFRHLRKNATRTAAVFGRVSHVLVHRYMRFHRARRFEPGARKLIFTGKGNHYGIGDRFRGILHAYLSAVLSDRVLLIAWAEPFPLTTVFRSAPGVSVMYDPRLDGTGLPRAPRADVFGAARNPRPFSGGGVRGGVREFPWCDCSLRGLGLLLSAHPVVVTRSEAPPSLRHVLLALRAHPEVPAARLLAPVLAEWRNATGARGDDSLYALIFRALLRPAPPLLAHIAAQPPAVRALVPPRLRPLRRGPRRAYVAVHARAGYGLGEARAYPRRFNLSRHGANLRMLAQCLADAAAAEADDADMPEPQAFYLACDTPALSKMLRQEIRQRSRGAVIVEIEGEKVHSNRMRKHSSEDRKRFILTVADLFFLSAGERMVSLASGFANLATWFGEVPHRGVNVAKCAGRKRREMGKDS